MRLIAPKTSISWKSRSVFGQGELSRSKSWCLWNRKCLGVYQLVLHWLQFLSLHLKVAQAQYQPGSCYVAPRGKGNQTASSITSSRYITRQAPHLGWRHQHGLRRLLLKEVWESLGGDRQVRAREHATVHTHMEAVRNAFSVTLSPCWRDTQHIFCKETYHHSLRIFGAWNGGLYVKSTGPWWKTPKWDSTFRCPNHCINASKGWAYRTRCPEGKQETTAVFSLGGNENVHFSKKLTAVAVAALYHRLPWHGSQCFEMRWVHCNHHRPPNQPSQPFWHQGLVFQHDKVQLLCPLDKGIPHALHFLAFLMLAVPCSTYVEHLSSETSRKATLQEGSAADANEITLHHLLHLNAQVRGRVRSFCCERFDSLNAIQVYLFHSVFCQTLCRSRHRKNLLPASKWWNSPWPAAYMRRDGQ